jgi:hypothetical protein
MIIEKRGIQDRNMDAVKFNGEWKKRFDFRRNEL